MSGATTTYRCETCGLQEDMDLEELLQHLREAHDLSAEKIHGRREFLMHMNATNGHTSIYRWTLDNGVSFTQTNHNPKRRK